MYVHCTYKYAREKKIKDIDMKHKFSKNCIISKLDCLFFFHCKNLV